MEEIKKQIEAIKKKIDELQKALDVIAPKVMVLETALRMAIDEIDKEGQG